MGSWADLNAWMIPAKAAEEWLRLASLLAEIDAPCETGDPDVWWPDQKAVNSSVTHGAIAACRGCPAWDACLDYALAARERQGIWGGTLPAERRGILPSVAA